MIKNQRNITIREGEQGAQNAAEFGEITAVIDVLRMSSTIVTALAHGANSINPVASIEEARTMKQQNPGVLLGGERNGIRPISFDLGNSPLEYSSDKVMGKNIIISTSNGTRILGVLKDSNTSQPIIIASALNVTASTKRIQALANSSGKNITLLAAGRLDKPSPEDHIIAHVIREYLITGKTALKPQVARKYFRESPHGKDLQEMGLGKDIDFCAQIDRYNIVPLVNNQFKIIRG